MICPDSNLDCDNVGCRRGGCQGRRPNLPLFRARADGASSSLPLFGAETVGAASALKAADRGADPLRLRQLAAAQHFAVPEAAPVP